MNGSFDSVDLGGGTLKQDSRPHLLANEQPMSARHTARLLGITSARTER